MKLRLRRTGAVRITLTLICLASLCLAQQIEIPSGTKVSCRLEQTISSETAEQGQQVQLATTEDVKVGDRVVIPQNSMVLGNIVAAQEKRRMGRTGKLDFSIDKVRAADGEFIPLRYTLNKKEGGSHAVSTGVMTAGAAVLFWPAAPFFLLRKGKDVTINKGIVIETFTDQSHVMKVPGSSPSLAGSASSNAVPGGPGATVTITSDVPGADIEIDGAFVGSTPTTRPLAAGTHKVKVSSGTRVWERSLLVESGGTINVNAKLGR
jgi:hypothetical protein